MKITFICGSLEPGKDGVGDYVRRLGCELIRQGNDIKIIALHDKFFKDENIVDESQSDGYTIVTVTRMPIRMSWKQRIEDAKTIVSQYKPDWISLQFVTYSFNNKGMPIGLGKRLKTIGGQCNWQIMFHELSIGKQPGLKKGLLNNIQIQIIKNIIKRIAPKVIHTHLPLYQNKLENWNLEVEKLPLFSNIPLFKNDLPEKDKSIFRIVFFSQIDSKETFLNFLVSICELLIRSGKTPEIYLMGANQFHNQYHKKIIEKSLSHLMPTVPVTLTGFLSTKEVGKILHCCDLGITPVPRHAVGKSGSIAAFLTYGVPVAAPYVMPGFEQYGIGFSDEHLRKSFITEDNLDEIASKKILVNVNKSHIFLETIAERFASSLNR